VVVMPIVDLSPQRDQEYFTIGLTEELVNSLARLPDLRVAAYKLNKTEGTRIDVRTDRRADARRHDARRQRHEGRHSGAHQGEADQAAGSRKALELDPKLPQVRFQLGAIHLINGDIADALREFQQETDETSRARGFAMAYHSAGRSAESDKHLQELVAEHQDDAAREIAQVYAWRDERTRLSTGSIAPTPRGTSDWRNSKANSCSVTCSGTAGGQFLKEKLKMP
jgi:hypothetical protein